MHKIFNDLNKQLKINFYNLITTLFFTAHNFVNESIIWDWLLKLWTSAVFTLLCPAKGDQPLI